MNLEIADGDSTASLVDRARGFLGLSLSEARLALGPDADEDDADEYGAMPLVTSIEDRAVFPGTLYGRDRIELVYLGEDAVGGMSPASLDPRNDAEPTTLRSRAGKKAQLRVYATEGLAYSVVGDAVQFVEVFSPRSAAEYTSQIYVEPPAFVR